MHKFCSLLKLSVLKVYGKKYNKVFKLNWYCIRMLNCALQCVSYRREREYTNSCSTDWYGHIAWSVSSVSVPFATCPAYDKSLTQNISIFSMTTYNLQNVIWKRKLLSLNWYIFYSSKIWSRFGNTQLKKWKFQALISRYFPR